MAYASGQEVALTRSSVKVLYGVGLILLLWGTALDLRGNVTAWRLVILGGLMGFIISQLLPFPKRSNDSSGSD